MPPPPDSGRILLVEADVGIRSVIERRLVEAGFRVTGCAAILPAADGEKQAPFDAVLASLDWPASSTARHVRSLKRSNPGTFVVLLCDPSRVQDAVNGLRHGADDYLLRPPDPHELRARLERIFERSSLASRVAFFQNELSKRAGRRTMEARSPSMRRVMARILRVAPMRSTVLISGESGVGKELVARSIHFESPRRDGPLIALNCAAIPASLIESELFGHERGSFTGAHSRLRGKFEIAHQGTLFLDEIGEMALETQAKLLRVIEGKEFMRIGGDRSITVDVRVIAATNAELETLVADSRFRRDLYYRLKVVTIRVPPLRERQEDLPQLVHTFLDQLARENGVERKKLAPGAMDLLQHYHWPGNVRELKNLLESLLVSIPGDVILIEDLPPLLQQVNRGLASATTVAGQTLADMERELIRSTLEQTGGNRTHSASLLGIGVRTLQRKIRTYEIDIKPTRRWSRRRRSSE